MQRPVFFWSVLAGRKIIRKSKKVRNFSKSQLGVMVQPSVEMLSVRDRLLAVNAKLICVQLFTPYNFNSTRSEL